MGCAVEQTERHYKDDPQDCFICKQSSDVRFIRVKPGVNYPKCAPIISPDPCELDSPYELLTDLPSQFKRIVGFVSCGEDFTEETSDSLGNCKLAMAKSPDLIMDANYVCWPEGTTAEMIEAFICHPECCFKFAKRTNCTPLPEQYRDRLPVEEKSEKATKTTETVPVTAQPQTKKKAGKAA